MRAGLRTEEVAVALARYGVMWLDDIRKRWGQGDAATCSRLVKELVDAGTCVVRRSRKDGRRRYAVVTKRGLEAACTAAGGGTARYAGSRYPAKYAERLADRTRLLLDLVEAGVPEDWIVVGSSLQLALRLPRNRSIVAAVRGPGRTVVLLQPPIPWRRVLARVFDEVSYVHVWVVVTDSLQAWGKQVREWMDHRPTRRVWVPRPGEAAPLLKEYLTDPGGWEVRLRQVLNPPARQTRSNPSLAIPGFELMTPRQRGALVQTLCILDGRFCSLHDFRPVPVDLLANRLAMTDEDLQRGLEVSGIVGLVSDEKQAQQLARALGWSRRFAYLWVSDQDACLWTVEDERLVPRKAQMSKEG